MLEETIKRQLGVSETPEEIRMNLNNNPYSLIKQYAGSYAIQLWVESIRAEMNNLFRLLAEKFGEKILPEIDNYNYIDDEKLIKEEAKPEIPQPRTVPELQKRFDDECKLLKSLFQQRDDLLKPMIKEWEEQQAKQIDQLFKDISPILKDKLPAGFNRFTEKDKQILAKVAKGHKIQIAHPELIPAEARPEIVVEKANLNTEINLLRIVTAKTESKDDPDKVVTLIPSKVKEWNRTLQPVLKMHFSHTKKQDEELANKQLPQSLQLKKVSEKIDSVKRELENMQNYGQNFANHRMPPRPKFPGMIQ